jgi:hypothetical protein
MPEELNLLKVSRNSREKCLMKNILQNTHFVNGFQFPLLDFRAHFLESGEKQIKLHTITLTLILDFKRFLCATDLPGKRERTIVQF